MRVLLATLAAALLLCTMSAPALASQVTITTDPSGAVVQIDGVSAGVSPVTIPKVGRGSHTLKISKDGYSTREDAIEVDGDSDLKIHAPLNPAPRIVAPQSPANNVPSNPQLFPTTPPPPPPQPPQPQYVTAQPVGQQQQPAPQQRVDNREQLPIPVSQLPVAWGTQKKSLVLVVETTPENASVQVIGLPTVKQAPATFTGFAAGTLQLLVRAPGYLDKRVAVDLVQDARTRVVLEPAGR